MTANMTGQNRGYFLLINKKLVEVRYAFFAPVLVRLSGYGCLPSNYALISINFRVGGGGFTHE
tara:strand:- start:251 stop:439 length:189 start_codon:yes stop_codon:yes gene_type:complete